MRLDVQVNFIVAIIVIIITTAITTATTIATTDNTNLTTTISPSADWKTVTIAIEMDDGESSKFLASLDFDANGNITQEEVIEREKKSELNSTLESAYSFYDWAPRLPTWLDAPPALTLNRLEPEFILDGVPNSAHHRLKFANAIGRNHTVLNDGVVSRVYSFSYVDNTTGKWWAIPPTGTKPSDHCQTVSLWALNSVAQSQSALFIAPVGWVVHSVNGSLISGDLQEVYIPASEGVFTKYWNVTFRPINMTTCPRNCAYSRWNCSLYSKVSGGCIGVDTYKFSRKIMLEAETGGWPCNRDRTEVLTGNDFRPDEYEYCQATSLKRGIASGMTSCDPVMSYLGIVLAFACIITVSTVVYFIVRSSLRHAS